MYLEELDGTRPALTEPYSLVSQFWVLKRQQTAAFYNFAFVL